MKRKYNINDNFFNEINSEQKAYLLGFFLADGTFNLGSRCVNSYRFNIKIQEEDSYILDEFKKYICPDTPVIKRTSYIDKKCINHKSTSQISWTSSIMNIDLMKYNILPKKTYDVDFIFPIELIPDNFIWDFIRGFFDGDGQISYSDKTHQSTLALYGTSYKFMEQIGNLFENEFGVTKRIEGVKKSNMILYTLRFHSNYKRVDFMDKLYIKFYKDKNIFLFRKQNKILKYLLFKYRDNSEDCERLLNIVEHSS